MTDKDEPKKEEPVKEEEDKAMEGRDPATDSDMWLHSPHFEPEFDKAMSEAIAEIVEAHRISGKP